MEIKASLMLEDLTTDLLISDIFETMAGANQFKEVNGINDLEHQLRTIQKNLSEIKDKFKIKHIEKIAHVLFSIKVHNTVIDFLIFPQIDRQFSISQEKIKEWAGLVQTFKN